MSVAEQPPTLPPGPTGSSEEELARLNADPFGYLEQLEKEYGTLFTLPLGTLGNEGFEHIPANGQWVFLTRPHQVKAMYEADEAQASGALANKVFFGTDEASVGYIDGKAHRCRRALLHPVFGGSKDYSPLILDVIERSVAQWPRHEPFPLFLELQKLTTQVITEVVCGNMSEEDRAEIRRMLLRTENASHSREEVLDADASIRAFLYKRIDGYLEQAQETGREDFLATLLRLGREGDESLTDDVVRDEAFSLLYTGFSTTANTLSWAFIRILGDDRVRGRLTEEVREVLGDQPITREILNQMPYMEATLKEVLRLHPVTPLNGVRLLKQPMELDGHMIPAGSITVHCAYLLQRSPDVWDAPEEFRPERFLDSATEPYAWGAFGGGSRMCVGRGFSFGEMKVILARMLTGYRMERSGGLPRAQLQGFFMAPEDYAQVVLREPVVV